MKQLVLKKKEKKKKRRFKEDPALCFLCRTDQYKYGELITCEMNRLHHKRTSAIQIEWIKPAREWIANIEWKQQIKLKTRKYYLQLIEATTTH